jgi:CheY-like chemotaxis protein
MSNILIVDDEPAVRFTLDALLRADGHRTFVTSGGAEAIDVFLRETIDLVFCDIRMPNPNGIETIVEMKRAKPYVTVIAMSGAGFLEDLDVLDFAKKLGADDSLRKPFGRAELVEILRKFLPPK